MENETKQEALDLAKVMDKSNPPMINSSDKLRTEISTFVVTQLNSIQGMDSLTEQAMNSISESLRLHELSPKEVLDVLKYVSTSKVSQIGVLLDIFKPTANSGSPLLPPKVENPMEPLQSTDNINPQSMQVLTKLIAKLGSIDTIND